MGIGTQAQCVPATNCGADATHVSKPPRSNRQNLARLEIVVTHSEQKPEANSNRQFLRPSRPLPWIQLQHEGLQLQLGGIFGTEYTESGLAGLAVAIPPLWGLTIPAWL
jgi:hypothetical protein